MHWASIALLVGLCMSNEDLRTVYLEAGYTEEYFSQQLDHINGDPGLINIKVLLKQGSPSSPLFVYTGNEGPIEAFFYMTGWLVYTLGPQYDATVAFIEHRYYGSSVPTPLNFAYLNTDQALLDFANIVIQLKPQENTPVVAFGGSYGGMLSAYFRIKFPHLVDGAIASSAPVLEYLDMPGLGLMHTTTQVYFDISPNCAFDILDGFNILDNFVQNEYTWPGLQEIFNTCGPITEQAQVLAIEDWITNALETYVQYNYPYPAIVQYYLPGWPANVTCSIIAIYNKPVRNMWETVQGLAAAAFLLYNNSGSEPCFNPWAQSNDPDSVAWTYQTCSELLMPQGQYGLPNDMFPLRPFQLPDFFTYCNQTFGVTPNVGWYQLNYGFDAYYTHSLRNISNIAFIYGTSDPWQSGCLKEAPNPNLSIIGIRGGAHVSDLLRPNPNDPMALLFARRQEQRLINQWTGLNIPPQ